MDYEKEIYSLAAETMALQAVLAAVLDRLSRSDANTRSVIAAGFDDAASYVEHVAIKLGRTAAPEHTVKAIKIVEGLRTLALGNTNQPKHGI